MIWTNYYTFLWTLCDALFTNYSTNKKIRLQLCVSGYTLQVSRLTKNHTNQTRQTTMKQRNHHNQTQEIIGCRPLRKQQSHSTVSSLLHLNQNTREQHRTYAITTKITNRRTTWSQNLTHTSRTESAKLEGHIEKGSKLRLKVGELK